MCHAAQPVIPAKAGIQKALLMEKHPAVYILASKRNGTLYTGVTSDLLRRVWEHKNDLAEGFTKQYSVHDLVYYETCDDMTSAINREKQIKKWNRRWKLELIEKCNPDWRDLYEELA
jgi:putative endonuclease